MRGLSLFAYPLCYIYSNPHELYLATRELWVRYCYCPNTLGLPSSLSSTLALIPTLTQTRCATGASCTAYRRSQARCCPTPTPTLAPTLTLTPTLTPTPTPTPAPSQAPRCHCRTSSMHIPCMHHAYTMHIPCTYHACTMHMHIPGTLLPLLHLFQSLLLLHAPQLCAHLQRLGLQPARLAAPWIAFAFAGYLPPEQAHHAT